MRLVFCLFVGSVSGLLSITPNTLRLLPNGAAGSAIVGDATVNQQVEFQGTDFVQSMVVYYGSGLNTKIGQCRVDSFTATTVQCTIVGPATGTVSMSIEIGGQPGTVGRDTFTFPNAPQVTRVVPPSAPTEAGIHITLDGTEFTALTTCTVGGVALPLSQTGGTATMQTGTLAPGTGARLNVQCRDSDTIVGVPAVGIFSYDPPNVTAIDCLSQGVLQIDGINFGPSGATVSINGALCANVAHDALYPHRRLTCNPAAFTGTASVVVTVGGQMDSVQFDHIALCDPPTPTCAYNFVCTSGTLRPGASCATATCTQDECCTPFPRCGVAYTCTNGTAKDASTQCTSARCSDSDCCTPWPKCGNFQCVRATPKGDIQCPAATCTADACCTPWPRCGSYRCDTGTPAPADLQCSSATCTAADCCHSITTCPLTFDCGADVRISPAPRCAANTQSLCTHTECCNRPDSVQCPATFSCRTGRQRSPPGHCATATCTQDECCTSNPTCPPDFQCSEGTLIDPLQTCASAVCGTSDCCRVVQCSPSISCPGASTCEGSLTCVNGVCTRGAASASGTACTVAGVANALPNTGRCNTGICDNLCLRQLEAFFVACCPTGTTSSLFASSDVSTICPELCARKQLNVCLDKFNLIRACPQVTQLLNDNVDLIRRYIEEKCNANSAPQASALTIASALGICAAI